MLQRKETVVFCFVVLLHNTEVYKCWMYTVSERALLVIVEEQELQNKWHQPCSEEFLLPYISFVFCAA